MRATLVGGAHLRDGIERFALGILLPIDLSVTIDFDLHVVAQRVDAAHAHAVQAAADLVGVLIELAASVQHRHHHLECRAVLLLVHVHWDAASVVFDGDGVVRVDADIDAGAEARQSLVDRVVHHLVYQVVQATLVDVANIHSRAHTHRLKSFEHCNIARTVVYILIFSHILYYSILYFRLQKYNFYSTWQNPSATLFQLFTNNLPPHPADTTATTCFADTNSIPATCFLYLQ